MSEISSARKNVDGPTLSHRHRIASCYTAKAEMAFLPITAAQPANDAYGFLVQEL
jgi:hypothetical protein